MAEEVKQENVAAEESSSSENKPVRQTRGYEPHGSASAPRPGDRKSGDH